MFATSGIAAANPKLAEIVQELREIAASRPSVRLAGHKTVKTGETIRRILEAAYAVFVREGHAGLSLRKVADEANIAVGNLTYHFSTKNELLHATLAERRAKYIDDHLTVMLHDSAEPREILLEIVSFYARNASDTYRYFYQMWGYAGTSEEARNIVRSLYAPIGRILLYLVRTARPDLDFDRALRLVAQISALEEGYRVLIGLGPDDNPALLKSETDIRAITARLLDSA